MRFILILGLCLHSAFASAADCSTEIRPGSVKLEWTAYKFTEKKAVKGEFKDPGYSAPKSKTLDELLKKVTFDIDPLKVDSGDVARDITLRNHFFKWLKQPNIKGSVTAVDKTSAKVLLEMNGVSKTINLKLTKDLKSVIAEGEIDIMDFMMKKSFEEINKACKDLHKGTDGVSKTWATVGLKISAEHFQVCK